MEHSEHKNRRRTRAWRLKEAPLIESGLPYTGIRDSEEVRYFYENGLLNSRYDIHSLATLSGDHMEYHRDGYLHREERPAVIDTRQGEWVEYWYDGVQEWAGQISELSQWLGPVFTAMRLSDGTIESRWRAPHSGRFCNARGEDFLRTVGVVTAKLSPDWPEEPVIVAESVSRGRYFIRMTPDAGLPHGRDDSKYFWTKKNNIRLKSLLPVRTIDENGFDKTVRSLTLFPEAYDFDFLKDGQKYQGPYWAHTLNWDDGRIEIGTGDHPECMNQSEYAYFKDGKLHGQEKPAFELWRQLEYWNNGRPHHDKFPAISRYDPVQEAHIHEYWWNGVLVKREYIDHKRCVRFVEMIEPELSHKWDGEEPVQERVPEYLKRTKEPIVFNDDEEIPF